MAAVPGEDPSRRLGPEKFCNHERLAQEALWPLVNEKWDDGDWLHDSVDGDELKFPKRGLHNDKILDIKLAAVCEYHKVVDGQPVLMRGVKLEIEELVVDNSDRLNIIEEIRRVYGQFITPEGSEDGDDDEYDDEEDEDEEEPSGGFNWIMQDPANLTVKKCLSFYFDSDGDWYVARTFMLDAPFERLTHDPSRYGETTEDGAEISEAYIKITDLEDIQAAFQILGASPALVNVLEELRQDPIEPEY
jgi:hypothetical protein